jgi:adenylate cyclase
MSLRPPSRRVVLLLAAAILAAGVALLCKATGAFEHLEQQSVDARFAVRGTQPRPKDIVVVAVDDKTLTEDKATLPLNRTHHAKVIEQLTKAGAGVIDYDFQFTTQSDDPDADNALIEAVAAADKIVLGTADINDDGSAPIFGGGEGLKYSGATPGDTFFGDDGIDRLRMVPFHPQGLRHAALVTVDLYRGHKTKTPPGKEAWIDFPGPPGTFRTLSFADVERGRFDPKAVRGKIVIVGSTASSAEDRRQTTTSGDGDMSTAELAAASVATILEGFPLKPASNWVNTLLTILLAVIAPLVAVRFGLLTALIAGLVAIAAFLAGAQLAFNSGSIVSFIPPIVGLFAGITLTVFVSSRQRSPAVNRMLDRLTGPGGNQRTRRLRALLLLGAAFFVVSVTLILDAGHVLRNADLSTIDQRFRIRGSEPTPNDIVIAAYDDNSFDAEARFPIPRQQWTRGIRNLTKAGAAVIAIDVVLSDRSGNDKVDANLVEAIHDAPRVVLSTTVTNGAGETTLLAFGKGLTYSRGIPAITLVHKDADGRVRNMIFRQQKLASFPLAAAEAKLGRPIKTPGGQTAWIDYVGGKGSIPYISYTDILHNRFDPKQVRGKVVVIGGTATSLQDQHNTATTRNVLMPGPEIQAQSIRTALEGFPIREVPWWVNALLIIGVGLAAPLAALRFSIVPAAGFAAAVVALFLVGAQVAFGHGRIVTVIYPFAAGIAAIILTAMIHALTVAFEREQARDAFARFVPEAVVDQVLADSDGARLGGVRGEATVMFSDLRGFTSFSETLEPERVIESLNRYLTEMSEAILDHGGTLVAYMGDGIMAVFGAPLKQDDHADRALEAARDMLSRMDGFNGWLRDQELHDGFKMGIGLNSGAVMSGNVGSERRLEYTALGDTTNTAARLEGMTKGTPHQLYISDTTKQKLTREAGDLIAVGEAEVRGRKAKVLLWSLRDGEAPAPAEPPSATVEA